MNAVMLFGEVSINGYEFEGQQFDSSAFESLKDLPDESPLDGVGLDHDEGSLFFHKSHLHVKMGMNQSFIELTLKAGRTVQEDT